MDDFAVVRQVQDLRAAMYAAVRDAERTAVPPQLLHVMEQARSPSLGKVRFLPPGLVTDASEVLEPPRSQVSADVKALIAQVYNWYVTLGEPLKRELSTRKFNRFLRDAGLLSPEMTGMSTSGSQFRSTMSGAMGRSQMSQR